MSADEKNQKYSAVDKEAATAFPSSDSECEVLCTELQEAFAELQGAKGKRRTQILARIRALRARLKELGCPDCPPK